MPIIEHEAVIQANPDAVFALISRVESFVDLTEAVSDIEALGNDCYRWQVRVAGFNLHFDVEVTETVAPSRFAWRSIGGIRHRGRYTLSPAPQGTHLRLELDYELRNRLLEKLTRRRAQSLVQRLSDEIVGNVENLV